VTICEVPGCDRPVIARGICDLHRVRRAQGIPDDQPVQRQATRAELAAATPRIIEARRGGATIQAIVEETGISYSTVSKILKQAGVGRPVTEIPHGTPSGWQWHKCRCDECLAARTEYKRLERLRRRARAGITAEHGTVRAYAQGCDCERCLAAVAETDRQRQARTVPGAHRHGRRWNALDAETAMRTDITIEERAALLGRTYAAVDDWLRAYLARPDDPYGVKPRT
jgi:hypothetical protein